MPAKTTGLGRGLDALLGDFDNDVRPGTKFTQEVPIDLIDANPNQPRKMFDEDRLTELAGSLRLHGMVQPIVVKRVGERYMIITGERRYRAAQLAKLRVVPIVERDYEDDQIHEIALIENIQRENLNPIEEAAAISFLMQQHDLTQEEVAERLSKSRPAVTNALRLLSLPEPIKEMLRSGTLSAGHGRALSALTEASQQIKLARQAADTHCSVRALEQMVTNIKESKFSSESEKQPAKSKSALESEIYDVEERMREKLGTKVKIVGGRRRGKITIEYYSAESLQEIYDTIMGLT